jgi:uroporphyrinogen decarboxylase
MAERTGSGDGALGGRERMLRAARGQPVDRAPVWLMRQAGRYLPEYRELRARHSFLALCRSSELAAELSLQPFRRFGVDGIVVFSDILLPLSGLGLELDFDPGPRIENPIEKPADLARLSGDAALAMEPTCDAIRRLRGEAGERAAVIGFAGAPWTLAAYACERRLSRDCEGLRSLAYRDPGLVDRLLDRMAEVCAATLVAQIDAGADLLQIFDTWAGVLSPERYRRLAGRALGVTLRALPATRPPVIVFARGAGHLLEELAGSGCDVVSVDWRTELRDAAARIGERVALQGNLDPAALFGAPDEIEREVVRLLAAGRHARGHILNLGHGVQQGTPVDGVAAFVRAARAEVLEL